MTSTAAIQGPLPAGLHRDETGEARLSYSHRTAEDFVLAAAALMRLCGREVVIRRDADINGFEYLSARSLTREWHDSAVTVNARRTSRSGGRWRLGSTIALTSRGVFETYRGYTKSTVAVEVYGR